MRASPFKGTNLRTKEALLHRMAKLTVEGRKLLVHRVVDCGWPPATAGEAQGCSSATAYKWVRRYKAEGLAGLQDRSSRPHNSPNRLSAERENAIVELRSTRLEGPHQIGWALGEKPSTVHKVLVRNNMPRLCDVDRATKTIVRYQRERPGELLHIDIKKQGRIPDGGGWRMLGRDRRKEFRTRAGDGIRVSTVGYDYLHVAVDDCSRTAFVEVLPDERKETATEFTRRAIAWFESQGITVERVMTDNGACYRSTPFRQLLESRGIKHKRTRPYRPQTNGKAERFNLTLKNGWLYSAAYSSNQQRTEALTDWLHYYNHHRPHMALKGKAPMSVLNNLCGNYN
jgi:transposase InsO family protein